MTDLSSSVRLNKHLALAMGISRREADDLISSGKVSLNGETAALGNPYNLGDRVIVNGKPIDTATKLRYVAFNKPVGYVCSRKAQGDVPTIYDLLPNDMRALKPVGRLDKDSSGLLLLTNDGDFAHSMTHPSFHKVKEYDVQLDKPLQPLHQQMISDYGIEIGDGTSKLSLERVGDERLRWKITMHEGRNRQIRRTFAALGYMVVSLNRTSFGLHKLHELQPGKYTELESI